MNKRHGNPKFQNLCMLLYGGTSRTIVVGIMKKKLKTDTAKNTEWYTQEGSLNNIIVVK